MGCVAIGTVDPKIFSQEALPVLTGRLRIYQSVAPQKLFLTEIVEATYSNGEDGELKGYEEVPHAADVVLTSAFIGERTVMPTAPHHGFGVSGQFLNQSPLNWPVIEAGTNLCLCFAIEPSVLSRAKPGNLPAFYDPVPRTVTVKIRANLEGVTVEMTRDPLMAAASIYAAFKASVPLARDVDAWRARWLRSRREGASVLMAAVRASAETDSPKCFG